jgi:hypothetical protein
MRLSSRFYAIAGALLSLCGLAVGQWGLSLLNLPAAASIVFWGSASVIFGFCLLLMGKDQKP